MSGQSCPATGRQEPKTIVQSGRHLGEAKRGGARGGKFDRERNAVELPAHCGDLK